MKMQSKENFANRILALGKVLPNLWAATFLISCVIFFVFDKASGLVILAIVNGLGAFGILVFTLGVIDGQVKDLDASSHPQFLDTWTYRHLPALCPSLLHHLYAHKQETSPISRQVRNMFVCAHASLVITSLLLILVPKFS